MQKKGKITKWNKEKGFGFITPINGGKQIFIHITAFNNRNNPPEINQNVSYDISQDKIGRSCAENASRLSDNLKISTKTTISFRELTIVLIFFSILVTLVLTNNMLFQILLLYFTISILTFIFYVRDKSAALNKNWRTSESTLHLLSLVGGWPGALIAQQNLRHKSSKQSFKNIFYITMFINIGILIYFLTPKGHETLISILIS